MLDVEERRALADVARALTRDDGTGVMKGIVRRASGNRSVSPRPHCLRRQRWAAYPTVTMPVGIAILVVLPARCALV